MTAPPGRAHAVRRLPAGVRRPDRGHPHGGARRRDPRGGGRPHRVRRGPDRRGPAPRRRTPRPPTRSTAGCRSAPSCTRAPATRAATPTSGCGWPTTARSSTTPASPGCTKLITPEKVRELLPEAADLDDRGLRRCPTSAASTSLIHGLLGQGVAASHPLRPAGQGARRVGPLAARGHPGGAAVTGIEREALRATAREFVRREVAPHLQEWEDAGEVPRELHRPPRSRACSASPSRRRSAARAATCSTRSRCRRRCSRPARPAG